MSFKKVGLSVFLLAFMSIHLICQNRVRIDLQSMQYNVGDIVTVPIQLITSGLRVAAYSIKIDFDDTVIEPISCQGVSPWSAFYNFQTNFAIVSGMKTGGQSTDFIGANLQFEVIGLPGQLSYLDITFRDLCNEKGESLLRAYTDGQIAINCNNDMDIKSPDFDVLDQGIYRANQSLNSNSTIDQTVKTVEFRAGQTVLLEHNFEVTKGSTFKALIQDCHDLSVTSFQKGANSQRLKNKKIANPKLPKSGIEIALDTEQTYILGRAIRIE